MLGEASSRGAARQTGHRGLAIPIQAETTAGVADFALNAAAMRDARQALWHAGYLVGHDRVTGSSPLGFGSDVTVGIATAFQIGGELVWLFTIEGVVVVGVSVAG